MSKGLTVYLDDIVKSIKDIEIFVKNITEEDFYQDLKTQRAVRATLEIIGEASKKLPDEFKKKHSGIPWRDMTDMRNVLIHD
ncbi:DUF86 domain-containing protein [bacterium]|nr:DUF86 domain-containing protein [bacterium]